jgi:hypothetical protein
MENETTEQTFGERVVEAAKLAVVEQLSSLGVSNNSHLWNHLLNNTVAIVSGDVAICGMTGTFLQQQQQLVERLNKKLRSPNDERTEFFYRSLIEQVNLDEKQQTLTFSADGVEFGYLLEAIVKKTACVAALEVVEKELKLEELHSTTNSKGVLKR